MTTRIKKIKKRKKESVRNDDSDNGFAFQLYTKIQSTAQQRNVESICIQYTLIHKKRKIQF